MTDWYGNRQDEEYTYRRVRWDPGNADHFTEGTDYGNVTRGSVSLAAFTDMKASCSFEFLGGDIPDTTDLVRIYYRFKDDGGEAAQVPLGTFFVEYGGTTYTSANGGLIARGTVNGSSVLSVLMAKRLGAPYTVAEGTDCVAEADRLIKGLGLLTSNPESPGTLTTGEHTFEADDSYLTLVNWLLQSANYSAVYPDPMGRVMIVPYVEPSKREPRVTFRDDSSSIMLPDLVQENDWQQTPNVCRLWYESDEECLYAVASCVSGSKASLQSRGGREVTMSEGVSELQGETQADRIAALEALAVQRLTDNSTEIEKATIVHALLDGLQPNDAVSIEYSGSNWAGNVVNMDITLEVSTPCTTKVRRFVPNSLEIESEGGALWQA